MNIMVSTLREFFGTRRNRRITVILDTGVLLADDLDNFFGSLTDNVSVRIPLNCWMEIDFLRKYSNFDGIRRKAENIRSLYSTGRWKKAPSVNNILANPKGLFGCFNTDVILFVFCEPLAAEEVSRRIGTVSNMHYVVISPFDSCSLYPPHDMGEHYVLPCSPLRNTTVGVRFTENSVFSVDERRNIQGRDLTEIRNIRGRDLTEIREGGEAVLFSCQSFPDKLIKIFKYTPGRSMTNKLVFLQKYESLFRNCALPIGLVYHKGKCVGYTMKRINGDTMQQFKNREPNETEKLNIIRKLFVLLLEMRIMSILVTDISNCNILIENENPVLIDCDSMQCCIFPGGGVTFPFGHPEVTPDFNYSKMRSHEHFNYSVAVMLWQLLLEWDNPYTQNGRDCRSCSSVDSSFPFTVSGMVDGITTSEGKLERWQSLPESLREAFCKTFNMEKSYSIGEWFELLQKSYENFE